MYRLGNGISASWSKIIGCLPGQKTNVSGATVLTLDWLAKRSPACRVWQGRNTQCIG